MLCLHLLGHPDVTCGFGEQFPCTDCSCLKYLMSLSLCFPLFGFVSLYLFEGFSSCGNMFGLSVEQAGEPALIGTAQLSLLLVEQF